MRSGEPANGPDFHQDRKRRGLTAITISLSMSGNDSERSIGSSGGEADEKVAKDDLGVSRSIDGGGLRYGDLTTWTCRMT